MQTNYKPVTCSAAGTKLPRTATATSAKLVLCSLEGYSRSPALSKQADQTSLGPYSDEERGSQNRVNELRIQLCTLQLSQISDLTFKKSECFSSTAKPQNHRINVRIRQLTATNISFPSKDKLYPGAPFAGVNVYLQHGTGHQRAAPGQSCITPGQVKTATKPLNFPTSFGATRFKPQIERESLTIIPSCHKGREKGREDKIQYWVGRFIQQIERLKMGPRELHSGGHRRQESTSRAKNTCIYSKCLVAHTHTPLQCIIFSS